MNRQLERLLLAVGILFIMIGGDYVAAAELNDASALLFTSQDEATMEKQIAAYLEKAHNLSANFKFSKNNDADLWLSYGITGKGHPEIKITVDTQASGRTNDGVVKERVIIVKAFFILPQGLKTPTNRAKLLELNNQWMIKKWMPHSVTLDKDMDIVFSNHINIPAQNIPIHAEMIYDILARNAASWKEYYAELASTLNLSLPAAKANTP